MPGNSNYIISQICKSFLDTNEFLLKLLLYIKKKKSTFINYEDTNAIKSG